MNQDVADNGAYDSGAGSVVVLLHGLGGSWQIWKPVISLLEMRHRVLALTLPGHWGGVPVPEGREATVAALAELLIEQLRSRGIQSAHVAGNSLGGWLALELARRGFAQSVVVFSPAGAWENAEDYKAISRPFRILFAVLPAVIVLTGGLLRFATIRRILGRQTMQHGDRVPAAEFRAMLGAMAKTRILPQLLKTMGRDGPIASLAVGNVPARIVWGACDQVIPFEKYGRPMLQRVPAAEHEEMAGVGHVPMYDDPHAVSSAIMNVATAVDSRRNSEEGVHL